MRRAAFSHAKTGAHFVEDLSGAALAAVKEVDAQFLKNVDLQLIKQGRILSSASFPFKHEETLTLVAFKLDKANLVDHQRKIALTRQNRVHELAPAQYAEFKVWQADPGLFYRARQEGDFGAAQRYEAALLLEEFKAGLTPHNATEKLASLKQKVSAQKASAQARLSQLRTKAEETSRHISALKKDLSQRQQELEKMKASAHEAAEMGMSVSFMAKEEARLKAALEEKEILLRRLRQEWNTAQDALESQTPIVAQLQTETWEAAQQIVAATTW